MWWGPLVAAAAALVVVVGPGPAGAAPGTPAPSSSEQGPDEKAPAAHDDDELLSEALETANRNYVAAKGKLDKARQQQKKLADEAKQAEDELKQLAPDLERIAISAYRVGPAGQAAMLLDSSSPDDFLARALGINEINAVNDGKVGELNAARARALAAKTALDLQVQEQQRLTAVMAKQRQDVEKSLDLLGGNRQIGKGFVAATSPVAKAAPRAADGSFRPESCTKDDPTTSGCITARTLNAYKETRKAGFNRFASCHRNGGPFEHPKGRACDWSLINKGFVHAQNKDQILYGNNLAAFLIRNADRLGIYYVIWYRQIWFPATGWKSYSGASDHTDHVHMSLL
ncbi:hypothetical protein [Plantactinospora sp. KBS50]|uniref:coiled-coil domain-containing protein n=1 Tax=Plantactinospora sp. KBS50 TaxID=2024580 RepID=UPI000BAABA71|nr:hypothetical protein [Plantactinospora sp. KBS50]ASW56864.1 hypothetical protein CIK06_25940 [Plantactinospora sp. KBS50]